MPAFSVTGKTAIVTGAGSGINYSFAKLLLERGCNVAIGDLALRPESQALLDEYDGKNGKPRAIFIQTDVISWPALDNMFKKTIEEFGSFDLVCPGAGIYEPHWSNFWHPPGSSESKDALDGGRYAMMDLNVTHPIRVTQIALSYWLYPEKAPRPAGSPILEKVSPKNPKRIVHISSVAGQLPALRTPMYTASKHAISGFVRSLATLDGHYGVRVNAVGPGLVRTPLWTEHPEKLVNVDASKDLWVTPEEVAEAMLALAEKDEYPGGTILEVGRNHTRKVEYANDPGPDMTPGAGIWTSNGDAGNDLVFGWLKNDGLWGYKGKL